MRTFKFLTNNDYYTPSLPRITNMVRTGRRSGRAIANELLSSPTTRECAVIASSVSDFNNWRNGLFDRNSVFIITNRDFIHTNGNNNQTTRYTGITRIDDCRGLTFDDYITTDRIEDILSSVFDDTIDSIRQLIVEVNLHTRDNETI
jgi:hypothetical protein